jgi:transposase-like protein
MTQTTRRRRQDANAWREILRRYAQSGLTVEAFCRSEGIGVWSLYRWRSRLGATVRGIEVADVRPERDTPSASFLDLGALGLSSSRFEVRLDLGGGVLLQLVRG